ncbi:MAG TPA: four-carbon acid sugar kinase family protein, partial [Candidatus Avacidaminococcus intestinavium]|nr:four-carbon acid sugar kinase family protein [Candidatus Avacidaminococcus intestinavium]
PVTVLLATDNLNNAQDSVVLDTESRVITPEAAYSKVKKATEDALKENVYEFVYKKVDSTLRGNIIPEIKAMVDAFQPELVVFAPAFPRAGRTTENGIQKVDGTPLLATEMVKDPRNPIKYDDLGKMLREELQIKPTHHNLEELRSRNLRIESGYHTFDAIYSKDMQLIAQVVMQSEKRTLWIGSAGLAEGFFKEKYPNNPVLAIMGSVSENSMEQMAYADKHNVPIVEIDMRELLKGASWTIYQKEAVTILQSGKDVIVTAARSKEKLSEVLKYAAQQGVSANKLSAMTKKMFGELTRGILEETKVSGMFLTGGDTAISIINELGAQGSRIESEVLTGFVLSRLDGGLYDGLPVITKAGAFGGLKDVYYSLNKIKEI